MPITAETRRRLLLMINRDAGLEPLDVRVAAEFIDKLAAGMRTWLDIDALTANVSASRVGIRNALERLVARGYFAVTGSQHSYAGITCAIVLGPMALTCDDVRR